MIHFRQLVRLAVLAALLPTAARAEGRAEALPALPLRALDGTSLPAEAFVRAGRWLLVYLSPRAGVTPGFVRELELARVSSGLVVVVEGTPEEARALAEGSGARLRATWAADSEHTFPQRLGIQTVPVVIGLSGRRIEWTLAGMSPDRATFRSILSSWR